MSPTVISAALLVILVTSAECVDTASLTVIHFNDFHSRFDPVNPKTAAHCKEAENDICIGGFGRLHAKIMELKQKDPQALVVNAGDVFTGTLWFGLFKENVTAEFMNLLPVDVQTIGNHEFDLDAADGVVNYLTLINDTPTIISNIDAKGEPKLDGFIQKSRIIRKNGLTIGVVGYVTQEYRNLENIGKLVILDEVSATNEEIKKIRAENNIDVVVAVTHAGYKEDIEIAANLDADVIVGGHSHTFLYTGEPPSYDRPAGKYPTVVTQANGRRVLIVQASAFSKYLGYLKVSFAKKNGRYEIESFDGNPILLDKTVRTHAAIEAKLAPWRAEVTKFGSRKVGKSLIDLDSSHGVCRTGECTLGRVITDSWIYEYTKKREGRSWSRAPAAVLQSGGLRSSIAAGDMTYVDIFEAIPFGDTVGMVELNGQHLKELLEFSVEHDKHASFLQMSGIKAKFDLTKPIGERVSDVFVRCATCPLPVYEPLTVHKYYRILMLNYLYDGGNGYSLIKKRARFWEPGRKDIDILQDYLEKFSPVFVELDENVSVHAHAETIARIKEAFDLKYGSP